MSRTQFCGSNLVQFVVPNLQFVWFKPRKIPTQLRQEKKKNTLYWLFNRDPYSMVYLDSPYNWLVFHPPKKYPKQPLGPCFPLLQLTACFGLGIQLELRVALHHLFHLQDDEAGEFPCEVSGRRVVKTCSKKYIGK